MKIGFCMFLWTTNVTSAHRPILEDLKATGYDGAEIPIFEGAPDDYYRLGEMLDRLGLDRTSVTAMGEPAMNLISPSASTRKKGVAYMRWAIDCAAALGARKISGPMHSTLGHFSGVGPTSEEKMRSVESQREIGDYAARKGITVCLEALNRFECYLLNTMDDLAAHIDEISHPNIRGMYDTFHANIEEADPVGAYTRNVRTFGHIHISENDRGVPGRGNIPWKKTFRAIRESGYDDWLTIESFGRGLPDLAAATKVWRDFAESPEAVYREGYRHIRKHWEKAGMALAH